MSYFFTSDQHYGHSNIIRYSGRPFTSVEEMNEAMICNYNSVVKPSDIVYHLGDFCLSREQDAINIVKRLNGQKFLVWGNHDKRLRRSAEFLRHWAWSKELTCVSIGDQKIILCHYALRTWHGQHRSNWQLHGHSHGSLSRLPGYKQLDVGVDCWNYTPVSFDTIKQEMDNIQFTPVDHHGDYKDD